MTKVVALFCLVNSVLCQASDPDNLYLHKGDVAGFEGVLMPTSRAQRVLEMSYNLDSCTKLSGLKDQETSLISQRLTNAQSENDRLALQVEKDNNNTFWTKTLYFLSGALVTGLVSYGAVRLYR